MRPRPFTILLVEDNAEDRSLIELALRDAQATGPIQFVECGEQAIAYLTGKNQYSDRARFAYPSFILTDLKMPQGDGFSVLEYLKSTPEFAIIPTMVLSASSDEDDIKKSYMLGASAYLVKPQEFERLKGLMKMVYEFWTACEVPEVDPSGKRLKTQSRGKLGQRFPQGK